MHIDEYKKVIGMTYREYAKYLQDKYGIPNSPYLYPNWEKVPGPAVPTRTAEGLTIHHVYEDCGEAMGSPGDAMLFPYEWQLPKNLLYCDYLEHLYCHILISEHPNPAKEPGMIVGLTAVINHSAPELNDWYSGYKGAPSWQQRCFAKVKGDKDLYLLLLKRYVRVAHRSDRLFEGGKFRNEFLCTTSPVHNGWDESKNAAIYEEIMHL